MTEKEDIITKTYDLLKYIIPQLAKFPRDQKFILADRIENHLLDFLEEMIEAYYSKEKLAILKKANFRLEKVRYLIRLAYDFQYFNLKRYELLCKEIDEIGRMVGGWRKSLSRSA